MTALLSLKDIFPSGPENFTLANLNPVFDKVTNYFFGFAGAVALIYLLWGGIQYITAGGSSEQAGKAKATITWAFIGLLVIIGAYALVKYFADIVILNSPTK